MNVKKIEWDLVPSTEKGLAAWTKAQTAVDAVLTERQLKPPNRTAREGRGHALKVLLANLMVDSKRRVIVPMYDELLRGKNRYTQVKRQSLLTVIEVLEGLQWIRVVRQGSQGDRRKANEVHALGDLRAQLAGCGAKDTELSPEGEIVMMKDKLDDDGHPLRRSRCVEYEDTDYTMLVRAQVQTINAHVADRVFHPRHSGRQSMQRYYSNGTFEQGGRMFRHWAQSIKKTERGELLIDGEPVVQVDYQASSARLLYARDGQQAPAGDLFNLNGYDRTGVKKVFNAILCRTAPGMHFPKGMREYFGPKVPFPAVFEELTTRFPMLPSVANTGIGLTLMRTESDCLMAAMLELVDRDIGFVPLFDALLVPVSEAGRAQYLMANGFRAVTGVALPFGALPKVTACSMGAEATLAGVKLLER